jgi:hypothetical protein
MLIELFPVGPRSLPPPVPRAAPPAWTPFSSWSPCRTAPPPSPQALRVLPPLQAQASSGTLRQPALSAGWLGPDQPPLLAASARRTTETLFEEAQAGGRGPALGCSYIVAVTTVRCKCDTSSQPSTSPAARPLHRPCRLQPRRVCDMWLLLFDLMFVCYNSDQREMRCSC